MREHLYYACCGVSLVCLVVSACLVARSVLVTQRPALVDVTCDGCGAVWQAYQGHRPRINACPNCPRSDEDFERLKEAARKRRDGTGSD